MRAIAPRETDMEPIIAPIKPDASGAQVVNLQDALLLLLDRQFIRSFDPPDLPTSDELQKLTVILKEERAQALFGESTRQLIRYFQIQQGLGDNLYGLVEDKTAAGINKILKSLGLLNGETAFVVSGTVTDQNGTPITGVRVVAFDRDVAAEDRLGNAVTGAEGTYRITYGEKQFRRSANERGGADLFVRVFDEQDRLLFQSRTMRNAPAELRLDVMLPGNQFTVSGTVTDANGKPAADVMVRAFDKDLRTEQLLGEARTGTSGHYQIRYNAEQFAPADATSDAAPDLVIRVSGADGRSLAESPVRFNAGRNETVDLVIDVPGLSEWEIITRAVVPLLIGQGIDGQPLPPWELNDDDITFIIGETGLEREQLRLWVLAEKMSHEVELMPPVSSAPTYLSYTSHTTADTVQGDFLEFIAFYGWFRDGQPQSFEELIRLSTDALMSSFERAIQALYIPSAIQKFAGQLRAALIERKIDESLRPASEGEPASIGDLLGTLPDHLFLKLEKQRLVAAVLDEHKREPEKLRARLEDAGLEHGQINDVIRTVALGELTSKHAAMVKALQPFAAKSENDTLTGLAVIKVDRWLDLAYEHGVPSSSFMTPEMYAQDLEAKVESILPTAVLAARLENGSITIRQPGFESVPELLHKNPDFDITKDDVEIFAEENSIEGPAASALGKLQHLKRLDANWDEVAVLVNNGLVSAAEITNLSKGRFNQMLGELIPEQRLEEIHIKATALRAVSIGLMGYLQPMLYGVSAKVMGTHKNLGAAKDTIDSNPTLRKIFGPLEQCYCPPCRSALSPAAYLADLLKFVDSGQGAGFMLRRRRPDIYDLELSCENSEIELPHIDLAIEILENAVAFPYRIPLPVGTGIAGELGVGRPAGENVRRALEKTVTDKPGDLFVQADNWTIQPLYLTLGATHWIVNDRHRTWYLEAYEEFFGLTGPVRTPLASTDLEKVIGDLDKNRVPLDISKSLYAALTAAVFKELPLSVTSAAVRESGRKISRIGKHWEIDFNAAGSAEIVLGGSIGGIILTDADGTKTVTLQYYAALLREIGARLSQGVMPAMLFRILSGESKYIRDGVIRGFVVTATATGNNKWRYDYTYTGTNELAYNPAEISVEGLSYQSTASDRNLFTRPQNRNKLAYDKLTASDACFPWSLPYDFPLAETREALRAADVSRLSLLELATADADRYNSIDMARERLELSPAEWELIVTASVDANGGATSRFWKIWGLSGALQALTDTFSDQKITALPFGKGGLLTRVSIVMQQSRLSFAELQQLLNTEFINPNNTISIQFDYVCQPSEMRFSADDENTLAPILDRLHRFTRLWRATGWEIWELDRAVSGVCNGTIDSNVVSGHEPLVQIANLGLLRKRLDLPIDVLVAMIGGFGSKRYSRLVNGDLKEVTPLYERLFQNRQLVDPPAEGLAFSATLSVLTDPLKELIAASVGIRRSDLATLLSSSDLDSPRPLLDNSSPDKKNKLLQWIFRNATLAMSLNLSIPDYARACRLFTAPHFTSTGALLAFLDEVGFVHGSGFSWSELEYLLSGTVPDQSEQGLSTRRAAEIVTSLQLGLRQLGVPENKGASVYFGLTQDSLQPPFMPKIPNSDEERWLRYGLEPVSGSSDWSVPDPLDSSLKIEAAPLELLMRVDVLARQAGLTTDTIKQVLQTVFIDPVTPHILRIKSQAGIETVQGLAETHLDRLERFLVMLRVSRLSPAELDLLLQAFCRTASTAGEPLSWNLDTLVEPAQSALTLSSRLQLSLDTITRWWIDQSGVDRDSLTEALGVGARDLKHLLTAFKSETAHDPLASPGALLKFADSCPLLKLRLDYVTQNLARAVSLEPDFVDRLLWDDLHLPGGKPAMQYFIFDRFENENFNDSTGRIDKSLLISSPAYVLLVRLHKVALLNSIWNATPAELSWIDAQAAQGTAGFTGLVFDSLPSAQAATQSLVAQWRRSTQLFRTVHSGPAVAPMTSAYLEAFRNAANDKPAAARASLALSFGLPDVTVTSCFNMLGITAREQYLDPLRFEDILGLLGTVQRLGIDNIGLERLVADSPGPAAAELARELLRTRLGEAAWEKAVRRVTDAVRTWQRDRLVDYLLAKEGLRDVNDLYGHFIIDVEMSPCMNTTRILQSTAAVQLFVQRCLFNVEQQVPPESIDKDRWEWMQNYRVWEANRKVFLYPENWLFPEVRDDRTETFNGFETALAQSEPKYENTVIALRQYLEELVKVSQISVMSMYEHVEATGAVNPATNIPLFRHTMYLVGRTPNAPYSFFWRKAIQYGEPGMRWTGWERIDLDLSGDHLVPFIFEGDFHLAWPIIKTIERSSKEYFEIQMAWAKKSSTGWTKRNISRDTIPLSDMPPIDKIKNQDIRSMFAFRLKPANIGQSDDTSVEIEISAKKVVPKPPPPEPPPSLLQWLGNSRINSSHLFWSLDISIRYSNVKYNNTNRSAAVAPANILLAGVVRETLANTLLSGRSDLIPKLWDDISGTIASFRSTLSDSDKTGLDILLAGSFALILSLVVIAPFAALPTITALPSLLQPFYPVLSSRLSSLLSAPVYRITGRDSDRLSLSTGNLVFTSDRMISYSPLSNSLNVTLTASSAFGQEVSFTTDIRGGVTSGNSLTIQADLLFTADLDPMTTPEPELRMETVGSIRLTSGLDEVVKTNMGQIRPSPSPIAGSLFWSSGYKLPSGNWPFLRSTSETNYYIQGRIISDRNERTYSAEAGKQRLLMRVAVPDGDLIDLYPLGYSEASLYVQKSATNPDNLFKLQTQMKGENSWFGVNSISDLVGPSPVVDDLVSNQSLCFDLSMPNAVYNWEVFYHLPIAAATHLTRQHRFEDARRWLHYVFDPTTDDADSGRERFWRFLPFRSAQTPDSINQLLETLARPDAPQSKKDDVEQQISAWLSDPFNPFAVARLRTSAFEWYTVVAYIKNLIEWADQLFRRDTRESINEATQLYIMAARIMGPKPEKIRDRGGLQQALSYRALKTLKGDLDSFSNAWLSLADSPLVKAWAAFLVWLAQHGIYEQSAWDQLAQISSIGSLYFGVPPNDKLQELWETVDDRLFKIRHCRNIEGVRRELALYEPPIDPELLIRAKAAGLDLEDVLADRFAPLPHYRFQILLQKANEFCSEVRGLGGAILSSIEKKEAERLALLRSSQEIVMSRLIESVKEEQISEAQANIDALTKTRSNSVDRLLFLQRQLGKNQITFDAAGSPIVEQALMAQVPETGAPDDFQSLALIQPEIDQIRNMDYSNIFSLSSGIARFGAAASHLVGLNPVAKPYAEAIGFASSAIGDAFGTVAAQFSYQEHRSSQMAVWQRRRDEWVQQSRMTAEEIRQIDKQIIALEIRKSIAGKELENHRKQMEHACIIDDYLNNMKFSGESLYSWMESQLAGLYFSAYQQAYDLAKRAERSFRFELGDAASSFVGFGYWDNLRKGLLSGDRLSQDLKRMEAAYLSRNRREFEITRHVSLRQLDPLALIQLRETGECEFSVPEALFDLDFPGHYFRRIKSTSLSLPCVVGPYTSVSGTLTLLSSKLRDNVSPDYAKEDNYKVSYLPTQSIAASTGQNDAGVFELNFRDERYLPFEGAGVISHWRFKLPEEFRPFDYNTVSDLLLHIRYTARDGGESLADAARASVRGCLNALKAQGEAEGGLWLLVDLRHDYPTEWHQFKQAPASPPSIKLAMDRFPFILRGKKIGLKEMRRASGTGTALTSMNVTSEAPVTISLSAADYQGNGVDSWLLFRYEVLNKQP